MSNINKQCTGPEQWDLIIDCCVTRISDLAFKSLPWTQFMADKTYLDGQNLMAALDKFAEAGLRRRKNRLADTSANKRNLIHIVMHFIAPMLLLFVRMMPRYRRRWGRNLQSQGFSIMARCDASTDFLVEPLSFIITYVEPDIAGKRAGESNTEQLSWHWPGDDESILLIFALIIDMTIWQSLMLQSPVSQSPAGKSQSFWAAGRSLIEMVVRTPVLVPTSSITVLVPNG